jgi:phage-related protein
MTAMERELGLTARTARTEFKEAMEASETGLAGVLEQLGLSEAQIATYSAKLGESSEVIQANADAHASTKTVIDKLKSSMSDLAFANGAMIEKASMMAPIFMAAGPIMAGFSGIMGILTPVVSAAKLAFIGLNLSMGPITLVIIGIGVAIVAAIVIWKNWDKIILALKKTLEVLKVTFKTVFDFIKEIVSKVFTTITAIFNSRLMWLLPHGALIKAIIFLAQNWEEIWDGIQAKFKTVTDALVGTFRSVKGTILGIWDGMVSGIKSAIDTIMSTIDRVINAASRVGGAIRSVTTLGGLVGREHGGPVAAGQPVIVGERRPELFVPRTSGTILPRITGASGGGGGGVGITVNLTINGNILGMDDFEQKITSVIRDAVLGGGFSGVLARA